MNIWFSHHSNLWLSLCIQVGHKLHAMHVLNTHAHVHVSNLCSVPADVVFPLHLLPSCIPFSCFWVFFLLSHTTFPCQHTHCTSDYSPLALSHRYFKPYEISRICFSGTMKSRLAFCMYYWPNSSILLPLTWCHLVWLLAWDPSKTLPVRFVSSRKVHKHLEILMASQNTNLINLKN